MSDEPIPKAALTTDTGIVATQGGSLPEEVGSLTPQVVEHRGLPKEVKRWSKQITKFARSYAPANKGMSVIPTPKLRKEIQ